MPEFYAAGQLKLGQKNDKQWIEELTEAPSQAAILLLPHTEDILPEAQRFFSLSLSVLCSPKCISSFFRFSNKLRKKSIATAVSVITKARYFA